MAGLVPAIHAAPWGFALQNFDEFLHERPNKISKPIRLHNDVDARDEPGHDDGPRRSLCRHPFGAMQPSRV